MKSLELENQSLHKGVCVCVRVGFSSLRVYRESYYVCPLVVENMRAALQKLESRVAVMEKAAAPAAVACAKVGD